MKKFQEINAYIGNLIRSIRIVRGLTIRELATRCGFCKTNQMQKYETGVSAICVNQLLRVAEVLEVPVEIFLYPQNTKNFSKLIEFVASDGVIEDERFKEIIMHFMQVQKNNDYIIDKTK